MTRYLVGCRATGASRSDLHVYDRPPTFYQPRKRDGSPDGDERVSWPGYHYSHHPRRGIVGEWRERDSGRMIIARVFPEEFEPQLSEHDAAVAAAEAKLKEARSERQEFLEIVAARAKPVRVEQARRERVEWSTSEAAKAEEEKRKVELAKSAEFMAKMNGVVGDFFGKAKR